MTYQWRPMHGDDIPAVSAISDEVHGAFTEPAAVYVERLALYPAGCFVLQQGHRIAGYLIAHPWRGEVSPPLGQPLGMLPAQADTLYLHDIALLPEARGSGAGRAALALVAGDAIRQGLPDISLTAVQGADRYWASLGFAYDEPGTSAAYGEGTYRMRKVMESGPGNKGPEE